MSHCHPEPTIETYPGGAVIVQPANIQPITDENANQILDEYGNHIDAEL